MLSKYQINRKVGIKIKMISIREVKVKYNNLGVPDTVYKGVIRQTDSYVTRLVIDLTDIPGDIINVGLNAKKDDGSTNKDGLIVCHPIVGQVKKYYVDINNWYTNIPGTLELTVQALSSMNGLTQVFNCSKINFAIEGTAIELDETVTPESYTVLSINSQTGVVEITHESVGDGSSIVKDNPDNPNAFKFKSLKGSEHIDIIENIDNIVVMLNDAVTTDIELQEAIDGLNLEIQELLNTHKTDLTAHGIDTLLSSLNTLSNTLQTHADNTDAHALNSVKDTITTIENTIATINGTLGNKANASDVLPNAHNVDENAHSDIRTLINTNASDIADINDSKIPSLIKSVELLVDGNNLPTGIFRFKRYDDSTFDIDTRLERVVTNFTYDNETQELVLLLDDDTELRIPMSAFIDDYSGSNGTQFVVSISNENVITVTMKDGTVTYNQLAQSLKDVIDSKQPNIIENIKVNGTTKVITDKTVDISLDNDTITHLYAGENLAVHDLVIIGVDGKWYKITNTTVNSKMDSPIGRVSKAVSSNQLAMVHIRGKFFLSPAVTQYDTKQFGQTLYLRGSWVNENVFRSDGTIINGLAPIYPSASYKPIGIWLTDTDIYLLPNPVTYSIDYNGKKLSGINGLDIKDTIPTVPTISTNIEADSSSNTKTASPKAVKTYVDNLIGDINSILEGI